MLARLESQVLCLATALLFLLTLQFQIALLLAFLLSDRISS